MSQGLFHSAGQLTGSGAVSPPPYFPSHPQSAAGALRSPFLCPPSLGLGSHASWPFSEAIKAPILQTQLCQPSAPCPSPISAPLPCPHGTGSRCLCNVQGLREEPSCLGPHPGLGKWGQVFQKLEGQALSVATVTDWQSSEEGPGLRGDGGELRC